MPTDYTAPASLPTHYTDDGILCSQGGAAPDPDTGRCPRGCDHAPHYSNDGHQACEDPAGPRPSRKSYTRQFATTGATDLQRVLSQDPDADVRNILDGLGDLLVLADESDHWTSAQMAAQIKDIVGWVHGGIWHDVIRLSHRQP